MEQCRNELTITAERIKNNPCYCIMAEEKVAGFYMLAKLNDKEVELDDLFIDKGFEGKGLGKKLQQHALETARVLGYKTIIIQADPNAQTFYEKQGAVQFGEKESLSIKGRMLTLLKINL